MGILTGSVAAATAVVNEDLLSSDVNTKLHTIEPYPRFITGIKLTGSTAAGDTKVSVRVGGIEYGQLFNTAAGFGNADDIQDIDFLVEEGERLALVVIDAPATNPINFSIYFDEDEEES